MALGLKRLCSEEKYIGYVPDRSRRSNKNTTGRSKVERRGPNSYCQHIIEVVQT